MFIKRVKIYQLEHDLFIEQVSNVDLFITVYQNEKKNYEKQINKYF